MEDQPLVRAIRLWTGYGDLAWPRRDEAAVFREFGEADGKKLLATLKILEDQFYVSEANSTAPDLIEMGVQAAADFRLKYPDAPEAVVDAFTWCYTFDHK